MSLKNHRVEIRISEEEKKLIEKIKLETKKNTADLFREFLNSYDIENHNKNLKILLEELEEEKEKIYSELHLVYHNLRSHYLPYRGLAPEQVKNSHKKFFTCSRAWYKRLFSCF